MSKLMLGCQLCLVIVSVRVLLFLAVRAEVLCELAISQVILFEINLLLLFHLLLDHCLLRCGVVELCSDEWLLSK